MQFLRSIKEGLKNPKKRSLIILGIYAVFFIFVITAIRTSSEPNYIREDDSSDKENKVTSYEYIYKINDNNNILEVTGTYKDNKNTFKYNNIDYYKEEDKLYVIENGMKNEIQEIDFNIDSYSYNNIENIIKNSEFIEKTTYKDKSEKTIYNILIQKYFELLNIENNCGLVDCSVISANITVESLDYIKHVIIDLKSYYNYDYNIEITYSNINNIDEIKINT